MADRLNYFTRITKLLQDDAQEKLPQVPYIKSGLIRRVDFLSIENSIYHRTNKFRLVNGPLRRAVFRRGQPFRLKIYTHGDHPVTVENLILQFYTGADAQYSNGSKVKLHIVESAEFPLRTKWAARLHRRSESRLTLEVRISPYCPVGVWYMSIVTEREHVPVPEHFYIIFNPWCKDDDVFMVTRRFKKEYVLNEDGITYEGVFDKHKKANGVGFRRWNFAQFSSTDSLPAAIYVLEKLQLRRRAFASPVLVTRGISCAVMSYISKSRWGGTYDRPEDPRMWKGSAQILKKFMTNLQQVKYGQCWVFAGIGITLCRTLGIPSRPVTNFSSGRDANDNLVIEKYLDERGRELPKKSYDFKWNFHVWCDCWMARPDLPDGYGGWQALEPCTSGDGHHRIGPASVRAVKEGLVGFNYDTLRMYSKVNSDEKVYKQNRAGQFEVIKHITDSVGKYIVTKGLRPGYREDITKNYKFTEGTPEERQVQKKAVAVAANRRYDGRDTSDRRRNDVVFDLLPIEEDPMIGEPVRMIVVATNDGSDRRTVTITIRADIVEYDQFVIRHLRIGKAGKRSFSETFKLSPNTKQIVKHEIQPQMYMSSEEPDTVIRISLIGSVLETSKHWVDEDTVYINKPEIHLEMPRELTINQTFVVKVMFENPLNIELQNCVFTFESNMFEGEMTLPFRNVTPLEKVLHYFELKPNYDGLCTFGVYFDSHLLKEVEGSVDVKCTDPNSTEKTKESILDEDSESDEDKDKESDVNKYAYKDSGLNRNSDEDSDKDSSQPRYRTHVTYY